MFIKFNAYWWLIIFFPILYLLGKNYINKENKKHKTPLFKNNQNEKINLKIFSIKMWLSVIGIFLILFAVWRPQWGTGLSKIQKKGLDIVFAVDVSKSMRALDFSQGNELISRLDATKYLIERFITKQKSDRIGLIEFAGESFVASPLTLDHTVFLSFLKNLSSDDLGKQGTNLAEAINVSLGRLEVQSFNKREKIILLFSDGDETISSEAEKMAKLAKTKNIKIFTIGIGSEKGMPIPEEQDAFGRIIYKKWKGETVLTSLNSDSLKKIAKITGGEYFHAEKISDLEYLAKKLEKLPKKLLKEEQTSPAAEKYFWFSFIGLLLFSSGFLLPINIFYNKNK